MPSLINLLAFAFVALGMVLTPGPNMIYLISRSIIHGRVAGLISLGGVALGFVFYMLCAAFGLTALVFATPYAYDALRLRTPEPTRAKSAGDDAASSRFR
jgi:threonine/homoserine/homoserine lactone efflux protein